MQSCLISRGLHACMLNHPASPAFPLGSPRAGPMLTTPRGIRHKPIAVATQSVTAGSTTVCIPSPSSPFASLTGTMLTQFISFTTHVYSYARRPSCPGHSGRVEWSQPEPHVEAHDPRTSRMFFTTETHPAASDVGFGSSSGQLVQKTHTHTHNRTPPWGETLSRPPLTVQTPGFGTSTKSKQFVLITLSTSPPNFI